MKKTIAGISNVGRKVDRYLSNLWSYLVMIWLFLDFSGDVLFSSMSLEEVLIEAIVLVGLLLLGARVISIGTAERKALFINTTPGSIDQAFYPNKTMPTLRSVHDKLESMLAIQDDLNKVVHPQWSTQGYNWEDAIVIEAVELFDHLPWKWWKNTFGKTEGIDWEQVKLEAVDIWHFMLSRILETENDPGSSVEIAKYIKEGPSVQQLSAAERVQEVRDRARIFINEVSQENVNTDNPWCTTYLYTYLELLSALGMSFDELYVTYIAKTQLNRLRWANGYGSTYIKTWNGQEDNVWLMDYVKTLDSDSQDFQEKVYEGLVLQYAKVVETDSLEKCNGLQ